jgi:GT2 family glycosyltransferase
MRPDIAPHLVSVIISTRDRPTQVHDCVRSLRKAGEVRPDVPFEVLVIENGSTLDRALHEGTIMRAAPEGTRLFRLCAGNLSGARNFGMLNARGTIFAFVDDDCLVDPEWLADVGRHARDMPEDFVMGGRVRLADPADLPFTIKDSDVPQVFSEDMNPGGFVQGCNFIMPRKTALRVGLFDGRFGSGARFKAGEDTDYIIRAHGAGVAIHYVPDMAVSHRHGRRSFPEINRLNRAYAYANGAILAKHLFRHTWLARHFFWTIRSSVREKVGGPPFDPLIGLAWATVARAQLAGFAGFVSSLLIGSEGARW